MMDDEDEFQDNDAGSFEDPVAARALAHVQQLRAAAQFRASGDDELYKEALDMAKAIRRSFRTLPAGEVVALSGGKSETG